MAKKRRTGRFSLKEDRQLIQMAADLATVEEAAAILRTSVETIERKAGDLAETKTAIRYLVKLGLKAKGKWTQTNFSRANGNRYSTGFCWHCSSSRLSIISSCHARAEGEEMKETQVAIAAAAFGRSFCCRM